MDTAADLVIVETEPIVPLGDIEPESVHTPGLFVDYVYQKESILSVNLNLLMAIRLWRARLSTRQLYVEILLGE